MRVLSLVAFLALIPSCGGDDDSSGTKKWQLIGEGQPSSLLAAWSSGMDNVWVVGGREGSLSGSPVVWHYNGSAWKKLDTGLTSVDLWQVFGFGDTVFLAGSNGTILRHKDGQFTKMPTPSADIVFGLWGTSENDVWAVGGQNTGRAFVWRYQGTAWTAVTGVPTELDTGGAIWKVVGRSATDVVMSASRGLVLSSSGANLVEERIGATGESLFSVGCTSTVCTAVGSNLANGVLYENAGSGWVSKVPTTDGPIWRGATPVGEHAFVVGQFGAVLRREGAGWVPDSHGLTIETLHAAWSDADGNLFAVGGKFDRPLTIDGVLLFKGATELPALP